MTPNASTWRSSADYEHLDVLTPSDLAWEWLRRNDAYDADFEASASGQGDPEPLTEQNEMVLINSYSRSLIQIRCRHLKMIKGSH